MKTEPVRAKQVNISLPGELVEMVHEWRHRQPRYLQPKDAYEHLLWRGLHAAEALPSRYPVRDDEEGVA